MYVLLHKQHPKVISLLCYMITAIFLGCAHKHLYKFVIQRDFVWLKGAMYMSGYTAYW